jgi:hypothetical protein
MTHIYWLGEDPKATGGGASVHPLEPASDDAALRITLDDPRLRTSQRVTVGDIRQVVIHHMPAAVDAMLRFGCSHWGGCLLF